MSSEPAGAAKPADGGRLGKALHMAAIGVHPLLLWLLIACTGEVIGSVLLVAWFAAWYWLWKYLTPLVSGAACAVLATRALV